MVTALCARGRLSRGDAVKYLGLHALLGGFLGLVAPLSVFAQETHLGLRASFSTHDTQNESFHYFGGELTRRWWTASSQPFSLSSDIELGVGRLSGGGDAALMTHLGVNLNLQPLAIPVKIVGGTGPTVLTRSRFGDADVGGTLHFTSHLGLKVQFGPWQGGYRYQHTSNAGRQSPNPGIDLHSFVFSMAF